jgi:co-chaperonin GroES (HSP10)
MAKEKLENVSDCKPLENRIVIRRLDYGEMSEGGLLHIPETAREERRLAEVLAIGPDVKDVKVGDTVLTVRFKGVDLQWGGENVKILRESPDVMAIVTPSEE